MLARRDSVSRPHRVGWSWDGRIVAMVVVFTIGQECVMAGELGGDSAPWRGPERDGANCLYLQLRLLGYKGDYKEIVAAIPGDPKEVSLGDLSRAATQLDFDLVPVKLTVPELSRQRRATMILFEEAGLGHGRFHLLLGFSPSKAVLVDGRFISRIEMPIDRFRRGWTGYALMPRPASLWPKRAFGMAVGAVVVCLATWLIHLLIRKRQRRTSTLLGRTIFFTSEIT